MTTYRIVERVEDDASKFKLQKKGAIMGWGDVKASAGDDPMGGDQVLWFSSETDARDWLSRVTIPPADRVVAIIEIL